MNQSIRLFVLEPQTIMRAAIAELIRSQEGMQVIGDAGNSSTDALDSISALTPDVVLVTAELPEQSSPQVVRTIKKACPKVKLLALASNKDKQAFQRLFKAGCNGYVLKQAAPEEFFEAIRIVATGASYISREMVSCLIDLVMSENNDPSHKAELSDREEQVMKLIARGYTSKDISKQMELSSKTVDTYRARIMAKLNLKNRSELIRYCAQRQLGESGLH